MAIPPEDRAPAGTNWYGKSMQQMWELVAGRQLTPHYTQASGWKRAGELAYLHKSRLETYRDKLAQAWPPESSDAAKAYLAKLDDLIKAVEDVARVSTQNHQYSSDIPAAFSEAERKLKPIRDEYDRIDRAVRNHQPVALPSGQTPEKFLQGKLNEARGVMRGLSADLSLVRVSMAPPKPYLPPGGHQSEGDNDYGGVVPPVIPPVTPFGGAIAPTPTVSGATLAPVPVAIGPDLTGLAPAPTPTTPTPTIPGVPGPVTPGGTPPFGTGPVIGAPPPIPGLPGVGGKPIGTSPVIGGLGPNANAPRAMPAGGVIGGAPGGGMGARAGAAGARANPVGGMIGGPGGGAGGRGAAGTVSGRGANGLGAPGVGAPGAGKRRDSDDPDFDPDTMWAVDQGVAPVLDAPDAPGPVDPGPAIGLAR
ncbi:hypothetical protein [Catellatospora vulcania]|uniref:hypothetical protein n=1 Tax=Catellatospora vulcania TaxID=1460450 RepID=UPI0012D3C3E3|nr:hypothetical protein [Catellatospora vulcania]